MRLPVVNGEDGKIDEKAAMEMVDYAMAHGINYYDTAWGYHNGTSELVMGKSPEPVIPGTNSSWPTNFPAMISETWIR